MKNLNKIILFLYLLEINKNKDDIKKFEVHFRLIIII